MGRLSGGNQPRIFSSGGFVRLHQEPDSPDIVVALAPVVGMDLIRFRVAGGVGLDLVDGQAGIDEYFGNLACSQPVDVLHLIAEQPLPGAVGVSQISLAAEFPLVECEMVIADVLRLEGEVRRDER
jgi:hypothetical protein